MHADSVRADIDNTISRVLGLPSFAPIRNLLSQEPIISNVALWQTGATAVPAGAGEQFSLLLPDHPSQR
jgi:hypothetical protein